MNLQNGMVVANPVKGVLSLVSDTTGAYEVFWTAEAGSDCETFILLKGQATVTRVSKCTTGRVFLIDVSGQRQAFYWLQDKDSSRDDEYLKKLKTHLEVPPAAPKPPSQTSGLQIDALQRILADLGGSDAAAAAGPEISLQDIVGSSLLLDALREDPAYYMSKLHEHLPPGTEPDADIVDEIKNPQVSAAAAMLQAALQDPSGFKEVTSAFKIEGSGMGVNSFFQRLLNESKKK